MLKQDTTVPDFTHADSHIRELLDCVHEIADLAAIVALAEWDQNTSMPVGAGEVRGNQMATLQGILHERWTTPILGQLLEELSDEVIEQNLLLMQTVG
jgi:carboxypeptidase Taq